MSERLKTVTGVAKGDRTAAEARSAVRAVDGDYGRLTVGPDGSYAYSPQGEDTGRTTAAYDVFTVVEDGVAVKIELVICNPVKRDGLDETRR